MTSKKIRVFINGFGRIGRSAARIMLEDEQFELAGINDLYSFEQIGYLLKYDSIYGTLPYDIQIEEGTLYIDEEKVKLFSEADPAKLDMGLLEVDVLLQCSGVCLTVISNLPLVQNGAKKVIVSAPSSDTMPTYMYGVNHHDYRGEAVISNSSCSANAIVPIFKIIDKHFGINSAMMSMYHSYTVYQNLLDSKHYSKDIRRTRSATQNIIPLVSGAAEATAYFFPHLKGNFAAKSIRVPIPAVTLYDLSITLSNHISKEEINQLFKQEINADDTKILAYTDTIEASDGYISNPHSAVLNLPLTAVVDGTLLRISAWQDNEYGYAKRLIDMARVVGVCTDG